MSPLSLILSLSKDARGRASEEKSLIDQYGQHVEI